MKTDGRTNQMDKKTVRNRWKKKQMDGKAVRNRWLIRADRRKGS